MARSRFAVLVLVCLSQLAFVPPGRAQEPPAPVETAPPEPPAPEPLPSSRLSLAVVSSGGAALGAYEAGYLHAMVEALKANGDIGRIRIVTGASAGSLNALLTVIESCSEPNGAPEDSWFYKVWTTPTLDRLFIPDQTRGTALFSRDALRARANELEIVWNRGLPESCDIVVGVPTTRVIPREVVLHPPSDFVPNTLERFVVRIRGRGPGRPPAVENYRGPGSGLGTALLPVDGEEAREFESVVDLLLASAAFPIAFGPVPLLHCIRTETAQAPCTLASATSALFVDGGVFENDPLGLAASIARTGLEPGRGGHSFKFRDAPDDSVVDLPPGVVFIQLDPHTYDFPLASPAEKPIADDAIGLSMQLADTFVNTARTHELQRLIEQHPGVRDLIRSTKTSHPPISSLLEDFFGMLDLDLLEFDFVLGMFDARQALESSVRAAMERAYGSGFELKRADPTKDSRLAQPLACMEAVLLGRGDARSSCAGERLRDFRAVLQVTLERTYTLCRELGDRRAATTHKHCLAAMKGERPPIVPGVRAVSDWALFPADDPTRASIIRLVDYGFRFDQLGVSGDNGAMVMRALRDRLGALGAALVEAQPRNRTALGVAVRTALDSLDYAPPRTNFHLTLSRTLEMGLSWGRPAGRVPWLRLATVVRMGGLYESLGTGDAFWRFAPAAGLEVDPLAWNGATFAWRFGTRLGYALSTYDSAGADPCPRDRPLQYRCSRMTSTTFAAVAVLGLVRAQLTFDAEPGIGEDQFFVWSLEPSLGFEWHSRH